jgi:hypothetical protein
MMKMIRTLAIVLIALGLVVACAKKEESTTAPEAATETAAPVQEAATPAVETSEAAPEASTDAVEAAPAGEVTTEAPASVPAEATEATEQPVQ